MQNGGKLAEAEMARRDAASLGNILIRKSYTTQERIDAAVRRQLEAAPPMGEILVEMGAITREQLEDALVEQKILRKEVSDETACEYRMAQNARQVEAIKEGFLQVTELSGAVAAKLNGRR